MTNGKDILNRKHRYKHYGKDRINKICSCDLQQFLLWYDESLLELRGRNFVLNQENIKDTIVVYPNMGYAPYTGRSFTPIEVLVDVLGIGYADALYGLNYFYYKVEKQPLATQLVNWSALSYSNRCAAGKNETLDLNTILTEDLFQSQVTDQKNYAYTRAIAYLSNRRGISTDIVLNFIKQGFLKMDKQYNLCFVAYADPFAKQEVTAISKKGTTEKKFCPNYVKEHNEGFFYARKDALESRSYRELYIFESPIDLLSFLTLEQERRIQLDEHDPNCCYISLNGAGNQGFVKKVLERYPTIQKVNLCLDNDTKGMEGAKSIQEQLSGCCMVEDLRLLFLKPASLETKEYCKDYNDLLRSSWGGGQASA